MRWLLRLFVRMIVFWIIIAPISYYFGLPKLIDYMTNKVRTEGYNQCITQMTNEKMIGVAGSGAPLTQAQGEGHCRCISDGLTFTRDDLMEMVQQKLDGKPQETPKALAAMAEKIMQQCNTKLQQLQTIPPAGMQPAQQPVAPTAPAPETGVIYIN